MSRLIVVRLFAGLAVMFAVATICFFLLKQAKGGPFDTEARQSEAVRRSLEQRFALDQPTTTQYLRYIQKLASGDLGYSYKQERSVNDIIAEHFPKSAAVGLMGLVVALGIGGLLGVLAAWKRNTGIDYAAMLIAMVGVSLSSFVVGPLLIAVFAIHLGWLPPGRIDGPSSYILPAFALGLVYIGTIARLLRAGMLEALSQDFIRTARAKGLGERAVLLRHALRVGVLPVVSFIGPAAAGLVSGSFVVEKIFQIPGLGMYFINSIGDRDHEVLAGIFVFYVGILTLLNLLADLVFAWLDPRSRQT